MPTLREIQIEWNALVPQAQARGIRVRALRSVHENLSLGMSRLAWLRAQLEPVSAGGQTFGVEIEGYLPTGRSRQDLEQMLRTAGIHVRVEHLNHITGPNWKIVTDGSLGNYDLGVEIVSPVLSGEEGFDQLRKVCQVLMTLRARVSRRCGFHVHVGARNRNVQFFKHLVKIYAQFEQVIDSVVAPSRRGHANSFCAPVRVIESRWNYATTIEDVARSIGQTTRRDTTRYKKLNLNAYWQHGTVEFRQHQGTVEVAKIENWVRFCLQVTAKASEAELPRPNEFTLETLLTTIDATPVQRAYFTARQAQFARS